MTGGPTNRQIASNVDGQEDHPESNVKVKRAHEEPVAAGII